MSSTCSVLEFVQQSGHTREDGVQREDIIMTSYVYCTCRYLIYKVRTLCIDNVARNHVILNLDHFDLYLILLMLLRLANHSYKIDWTSTAPWLYLSIRTTSGPPTVGATASLYHWTVANNQYVCFPHCCDNNLLQSLKYDAFPLVFLRPISV